MGAWDHVMRANWHVWRLSPENNAEARKFASQAMKLDPRMARAWVVHAMCDIWDVLYGWSENRLKSLASAHAMAQRAVEIDSRDAEAHTILGVVTLFTRDFNDAPRRLETALQLNANLAFAHMWGGGYYAFTGESGKARKHLKEALRLSPRDPANYWTFAFLGLADFFEEHYGEAVEWALKSIHLHHAFPTGHRLLAACHAMLGETGRAEAALKDLLCVAPGTTIASTRAGVPWKDAAIMDRYLDALRKAGLPE
jgi:adenylate cyclase